MEYHIHLEDVVSIGIRKKGGKPAGPAPICEVLVILYYVSDSRLWIIFCLLMLPGVFGKKGERRVFLAPRGWGVVQLKYWNAEDICFRQMSGVVQLCYRGKLDVWTVLFTLTMATDV